MELRINSAHPGARIDHARRLVRAYGWNTTCSQILNPGIEHWFSRDGDAVVGYVRRAGVRVVAGAPVCAPERLHAVIQEWEASVGRDRVCYFAAEERLHAALAGKEGRTTIVVGAQPRWRPESFVENCRRDSTLRYQLARARRKGVTVDEWPPASADDPRLWQILEEWLHSRGLPKMHFLVEPDTLRHLVDRKLFVASVRGNPVGFVVLAPVPARHGWLTEQFPRASNAPNGAVELTLMTAIEALCDGGSEFVTMGIVPLSLQAGEVAPGWLKGVVAWARAHGRRFYNFRGLEAFKAKFRPEAWEPIYVISGESQFSFRTLYAISAAFSDGPPVIAMLRGLGRAVRQEWRWWRARRHG